MKLKLKQNSQNHEVRQDPAPGEHHFRVPGMFICARDICLFHKPVVKLEIYTETLKDENEN